MFIISEIRNNLSKIKSSIPKIVNREILFIFFVSNTCWWLARRCHFPHGQRRSCPFFASHHCFLTRKSNEAKIARWHLNHASKWYVSTLATNDIRPWSYHRSHCCLCLHFFDIYVFCFILRDFSPIFCDQRSYSHQSRDVYYFVCSCRAANRVVKFEYSISPFYTHLISIGSVMLASSILRYRWILHDIDATVLLENGNILYRLSESEFVIFVKKIVVVTDESVKITLSTKQIFISNKYTKLSNTHLKIKETATRYSQRPTASGNSSNAVGGRHSTDCGDKYVSTLYVIIPRIVPGTRGKRPIEEYCSSQMQLECET